MLFLVLLISLAQVTSALSTAVTFKSPYTLATTQSFTFIFDVDLVTLAQKTPTWNMCTQIVGTLALTTAPYNKNIPVGTHSCRKRVLVLLILTLCGDIHANPGPVGFKQPINPDPCHWGGE